MRFFAEFAALDDVWSTAFIDALVLQVVGPTPSSIESRVDHLRELGVNSLYKTSPVIDGRQLPQGPYFIQNGQLHQAYRLYPDTADAFVVATVPDDYQDGFHPLDAAAYGEQHPSTLTIAVPSRLYSLPTEERPFAGKRVAIKDIIHLKGLKTGASSRAFTDFHPPRNHTAPVVQDLIDQGFVVVGKTKTTQFADSEWPTRDWVDYHGPFNPRGDGYLTPSGSSAGSAAAVATYPWLDFALGSDTLGSIRAPAAAQAIFGMRPTLGATSTEGMVPYSANWDTLGGFARTASEFEILANALYGTGSDTRDRMLKLCFLSREVELPSLRRTRPTTLLIPEDYWEIEDGESARVFEEFIARLEDFLQVKRTRVNLQESWKETRPKGMDESLASAFHYVFDWSANRDQWTDLLKPFIDSYREEEGKHPVLNPQVRFKVSYTRTITAEQKREGEELIGVFKDWFYTHIMPPSENGYSPSIMALPWTDGQVTYRDEYAVGPQQFTGQGFFFYNIGPYARCPELIIPVGYTPYVSKYTDSEEGLPAAVGIMAAEGSDVMLTQLVAGLFGKDGFEASDRNSTGLWDEL
ncbi:aspartyl-tRNA(Asn)/glutamyl-tRNA(Gln) amidotransferase subunit A [Geosmithia morbida]|uniref:Aspartyl-tRNA(Asn)/glutamyl-tRNA(Gln) amidotransferase subunit A n=1 Tax=Geosmithia morbida TaxID=1094350 RepID=A0A9P5D0Q1_9HYPO|nr:aspartyl-tRNA(Asn)/glutamyl-tRNA(Gln) amidotransferase subunit A [Geosmithia morbida]KAF4119671.1 aspartyl-tRNA(Asn)/glutamyl-tRNA(Gln) amidotransferase subunit A [Geosmithia morbida]